MLSAVVLAKDAAEVLPECLASLKWCDELVVIDDFSSDATPKMASQAGARVIQHALKDDFSAQRNFALTQATGDWVLFVDADERVSPKLAQEIKAACHQTRYSGFYLRRRDYLFGRPLNHGETQAVKLLRLAKQGSGKWLRPVHETWQISGPVGQLNQSLIHYPHPSLTSLFTKINYYSTLHAQVLKSQGVHSDLGQIIFYPVAKFGLNYLLRFGFLDGMPGFIMAWAMAFHSFLSRAKLYLLWKE